MGLSDQPFDVMCPDCGGMLKVDPVTRSVIAHTPAPRKKMFEDFGEAAKALKESDARRESIFAQSVQEQGRSNGEEVRRSREEGEGVAAERQAAAGLRSGVSPLIGFAPALVWGAPLALQGRA